MKVAIFALALVALVAGASGESVLARGFSGMAGAIARARAAVGRAGARARAAEGS